MSKIKTLFSEKLKARMEELDMSIINLSDATGATYEHVRRVAAGDSLPSPYFLRTVCGVIGLDFEEMNKVISADKVRTKYGKALPELLMAGKDPSLAPVEKIWTKLKDEQKVAIIRQANQYIQENRRAS